MDEPSLRRAEPFSLVLVRVRSERSYIGRDRFDLELSVPVRFMITSENNVMYSLSSARFKWYQNKKTQESSDHFVSLTSSVREWLEDPSSVLG